MQQAPPSLASAVVERYRALLERADAEARRWRRAYSEEIRCRAGCSECCSSRFELSLLEGFHLLQGFATLPEPERAAVRVRARAHLMPLPEGQAAAPAPTHLLKDLPPEQARDLLGDPCPLLAPDGRCRVYEWRPLVCRSHGYPRHSGGAASELDYCYHNFASLREGGEEPEDEAPFPLRALVDELETLLGDFNAALFDAPGLRSAAPIAAYLVAADRSLEQWAAALEPQAAPAFVAVRRFFEVLGSRPEARRCVAAPGAAEASQRWAAEALRDTALAADLELVVDACLDRLAGESIDGRALAALLRQRGPEFRRHAQLLVLEILRDHED